jgi:hypothetical protein
MKISRESIMNPDDAIAIWRGSQYRAINGKLLQDKVGKEIAKRYIGSTTMPSNIDEIIQTLRNDMKPILRKGPYYRGCSKRFEKNCHLETFVSISKNREDAVSFVDEGGNVYSITLAEGVRGRIAGSEGETLLEDGCYWEYHGGANNNVTIHPPSANKGYEWCSASEEKPAVMCHSLTLSEEEEKYFKQFEGGRKRRKTRRYKMPRKMTRKYCKKTPCRKMGFTQRASCRPWKNCYKNKK